MPADDETADLSIRPAARPTSPPRADPASPAAADPGALVTAGEAAIPEQRTSPSLPLPHPDLRALAAIFVGGAAGGLLRTWLAVEFASAPDAWPWAIFAVNVSGCLALGYFATRLAERLPQSTYRRPLLATGFCGAYTTFSTVQVEILTMLDADRIGLAAGYAAASIAAGYLAIWVATAGVRRVRTIA